MEIHSSARGGEITFGQGTRKTGKINALFVESHSPFQMLTDILKIIYLRLISFICKSKKTLKRLYIPFSALVCYRLTYQPASGGHLFTPLPFPSSTVRNRSTYKLANIQFSFVRQKRDLMNRKTAAFNLCGASCNLSVLSKENCVNEV